MTDMNHLDKEGNVHMVDVGHKHVTARIAVAEAVVSMEDGTAEKLFGGQLNKGDALATVRLAAIQATKRTPDLIPLCHPLAIERVDVSVERVDIGARIEVLVGVEGKTGVEMEAMTGAAIGALAMYDMIKGVDRTATVHAVRLLSKTGGASGDWQRG